LSIIKIYIYKIEKQYATLNVLECFECIGANVPTKKTSIPQLLLISYLVIMIFVKK